MMALIVVVIVCFVIGIWGWPLLIAVLGLSTVTDKSSALQRIRQLMNDHDISPADVELCFNEPRTQRPKAAQSNNSNVAKTLFIYLGAIFVLAGVGTYTATFWDQMGSVMRILVTLGVAYILFVLLVLALYEKKYPKLIVPLSLACAFFMVIGWYVFIDEIFPNGARWRFATLAVFGVILLHFYLLFVCFSRTVFAFLSLIFFYGSMYVGFDLLGLSATHISILFGASLLIVGSELENTAQRALGEPVLLIGVFWLNVGLFDLLALFVSANWASLITGFCLMSTGYGLLLSARYPRLVMLGYLFGSILFYSGLFDLVQYTSFELVYLAATVSMLYVSVILHSRILLMTTSLAMLSFIGYFSAQHFSTSLGWPLTLIFTGIVFLGVGSIALRLRKNIKTSM